MINCLICDRIDLIKKGKNSKFIKEFSTGYLVLEDYQYYKGYCIFISKKHVHELHELEDERYMYLREMAVIAECIFDVFKPVKLNYELLGNNEKHLHWHIIPRYNDDSNPTSPIWVIDKKIRQPTNNIPSEEFVRDSINAINEKLLLIKQ